MKKMNKKGFTIVELVIVIAVIAILSAVMIPTFSGMIKKSKASAALQEANSAKTAVLAEENGQFNDKAEYYFINGDYVFKMNKEGVLEEATKKDVFGEPVEGKYSYQTLANDIIYTVDDTKISDLKAVTGDNPATKDETETDYLLNVVELEDLGNVVVLVKAPAENA